MAGAVVQPEAADACPCGHSHQSHVRYPHTHVWLYMCVL